MKGSTAIASALAVLALAAAPAAQASTRTAIYTPQPCVVSPGEGYPGAQFAVPPRGACSVVYNTLSYPGAIYLHLTSSTRPLMVGWEEAWWPTAGGKTSFIEGTVRVRAPYEVQLPRMSHGRAGTYQYQIVAGYYPVSGAVTAKMQAHSRIWLSSN